MESRLGSPESLTQQLLVCGYVTQCTEIEVANQPVLKCRDYPGGSNVTTKALKGRQEKQKREAGAAEGHVNTQTRL